MDQVHEVDTDLRPLRHAPTLEALFAAPVSAFEVCGPVDESALLPAERRIGEHAAPKRRRELAEGRACAHAALAELGIHDFAVCPGEGRAPIWPEGVVGSISHTAGYCGAVAAATSRYVALGLDVERRERVGRSLEARICTDADRAWLGRQPGSRRAELATLIFSAKEAFFKCQFPLTRAWLGFQDANLRIEEDRFEVQLTKGPDWLLARRGALAGRYRFHGDHVFTGIALEPA